MLHIALWEPEIPPNTGNIARLCAATGVPMHLIGRLGFRIDNRSLRRAGLDYWSAVEMHQHADFVAFEEYMSKSVLRDDGPRIWCFSAHSQRRYTEVQYQAGDCLLFGNESRGLPTSIRERYAEQLVTIPILTEHVRTLNLATAVGIGLYEALRQLHSW